MQKAYPYSLFGYFLMTFDNCLKHNIEVQVSETDSANTKLIWTYDQSSGGLRWFENKTESIWIGLQKDSYFILLARVWMEAEFIRSFIQQMCMGHL